MSRAPTIVRVIAVFAIGCGSSSGDQLDAATGGSDTGSDQGTGSAAPGAHGLAYYKLGGSSPATISLPALDTQAGSTMVISVGRGTSSLFALPTDNQGDAYSQQDTAHPYSLYPHSGTALYTFKPTKGGGLTITNTTGQNGDNTSQSDEITIAAVEVQRSGKIQDVEWSEVRAPPLTSKKVTTDGPATLVAFWWGDGFPGTPQRATPNNGFTVVNTNAQETDSFVQCAVATKQVTEAGAYDVTWTPDPSQGAQLWLVAIE